MALMYPSRRRGMTPQNRMANQQKQRMAPQPDQVSPNNTQTPRRSAQAYMAPQASTTAGAGWRGGLPRAGDRVPTPGSQGMNLPPITFPGGSPPRADSGGTSPGVPATPQPAPQAPAPAPAPQPTPMPVNNQGAGLPLDAEFEAVRRQLDAELAMTLSQLGVARDLIPAQVEQYRQRLFTDQGFTHRDINENDNARGIYFSGIRPDDINEANIAYERNWQDEQQRATGQLGDLANQEAVARSNYQRQLQEAMLEYSKWLYENTPTTVGGEDTGGGGGGNSSGSNNKSPGAPSGKPGTKTPISTSPHGPGGTVKVPPKTTKGWSGSNKWNPTSKRRSEQQKKPKGK